MCAGDSFKRVVRNHIKKFQKIESQKQLDQQIENTNHWKYEFFYPIYFICEFFKRKYQLSGTNTFELLDKIPDTEISSQAKKEFSSALKLLFDFRYVLSAMIFKYDREHNIPIKVDEMPKRLKLIFDDSKKAKAADVLNFSGYTELENALLKAITTIKNTGINLFESLLETPRQ